MMRQLVRVDPDGNRHEIWVNTDHVLTVTPAEGGHSWVAVTPRSEGEQAIKVVGWARDVALGLNGYFDD